MVLGLNEHHITAFIIFVFFFWMTQNPISAGIAACGGYFGAKHFGDKFGGNRKEEEKGENEERKT